MYKIWRNKIRRNLINFDLIRFVLEFVFKIILRSNDFK